jgi:hypothetical protein
MNTSPTSPLPADKVQELLKLLYSRASNNENSVQRGDYSREEWFAHQEADVLSSAAAIQQLCAEAIIFELARLLPPPGTLYPGFDLMPHIKQRIAELKQASQTGDGGSDNG